MKRDRLEREVTAVVRNGNCSGCGGCSLISSRIHMELREGFMRPAIRPRANSSSDRQEAADFRASCPGLSVAKPDPSAKEHEIFGRFVSVWEGWATDDALRHAGSSGGVLTALSVWALSEGETSKVLGVAASTDRPSRSVPVSISTRDEAIAAAGSRYAPVSTLSAAGQGEGLVIGKPCEVAALRKLSDRQEGPTPLLFSFFCAGTPSQTATSRVLEHLDVNEDDVSALRYRGNGWPGEFSATTSHSGRSAMSYEQSWGQILGQDVQWRCKLCVDGTGESADIAVGDYWKTDDRGFPSFTDAEGSSVVIARTLRGHRAVLAAVDAGHLALSPVSLDDVATVQPLQVERRSFLFARLLGRRLAGYRVPSYPGYPLILRSIRAPKRAFRVAVGTFLRSRGLR